MKGGKNMERNKKALKIVSYVMIMLALVSAITIAIDFFSGNFSEETLSKAVGGQWNSALYVPVLVAFIAILAFFILLYVFLGIRGIKQADGKVYKYGHITLATVLFVLDFISCIFGILAIRNKTVDASSFSQSTLVTIILFLYISSAKALKEN